MNIKAVNAWGFLFTKKINTFISNDFSLTQWPLLITFFDHGFYESLKQDIHFFIIIRHKNEKEKNVN